MDMFDFSAILDFIKLEPGHGLMQTVLLFMIWLQSKGLRREIASLRDGLAEARSTMDKRFEKIEWRITVIENKWGRESGRNSKDSKNPGANT